MQRDRVFSASLAASLAVLAALACAATKSEPPSEPAAAPAADPVDRPCVCGSAGPCPGFVILRFDLSADGVVSNPEPVNACGDEQDIATATEVFVSRNLGPQPSAREDLEVLLVLRPDAAEAPSPEPELR